jgi:hypothetical protein
MGKGAGYPRPIAEHIIDNIEALFGLLHQIVESWVLLHARTTGSALTARLTT